MISLAVKYRPKVLDDVIGQDTIIKILKRLIELHQFKNSYLFCGNSGCGKTTIARAFAKQINDPNNSNINYSPIEIDAASNNGVENIREIVKYAAERSLDSEYKIYIIDECHALSSAAWQAFLKCIEEPPAYTVFMFCTTDVLKVPATIINRCMRFNLNRIPANKIADRLYYICKEENISSYKETCDYISKVSNNQMRDAICNLEKVIAFDSNLSVDLATSVLAGFSYKIFFNLLNNLVDGNYPTVSNIINEEYNKGCDLQLFTDQFLTFTLGVLKYSIFKDTSILEIPDVFKSDLDFSINFDNSSKFYGYIVDRLLELKNMLKTDFSKKNTVEVMFYKICNLK